MYYYGMAAVPEWAPPGENHLLRSSSVVKSITYTNSGVSYTTWDPASTEVFRLSSVPGEVLANGIPLPRRADLAQPGWTYDENSGVLRVRHDSATQIQVVYDPPLQPPSSRAFPPGAKVRTCSSPGRRTSPVLCPNTRPARPRTGSRLRLRPSSLTASSPSPARYRPLEYSTGSSNSDLRSNASRLSQQLETSEAGIFWSIGRSRLDALLSQGRACDLLSAGLEVRSWPLCINLLVGAATVSRISRHTCQLSMKTCHA